MDNLFPELAHTHVVRERDKKAWRDATLNERALYRLFQVFLQGCNWRLTVERWISRIKGVSPEHWPAIPETKHRSLNNRSAAERNNNADHSV